MSITEHNSGLIIVDVQGKLASLVKQSDSVVHNIAALIQGCKLLRIPILWLEQQPKKLGSTVEPIAHYLTGLTPIEKSTFSAFQQPEFETQLRTLNKPNWLVCGIETHICVYQTVQDMLSHNYNIHVVTDAVSSRTTDNKEIAIQKMTRLGAQLTSVEMALYELLKDSDREEFKHILKLIK